MAAKIKRWTLDMANKWKNYKPPIRPSKYDLEVFKKYIKEKAKKYGKDTKILILGSTPEFRDLVSKEKLTAYVCDYNKRNYIALTLLKKYKGKEVLIQQDWRKLKLKDKFDLVLGEASLNMVKADEVPLILKSVKKILKDDGLLIFKMWVRLPRSALSLKKILKTYRTKYKNKNFKNCMNQQLHSLYYHKEKGSLHKQYLTFKKLYEKGILTKKEFSTVLGLGYETSPLALYLPSKTEFSKIVRKYMKIVKIITPKQIGTNKIPIYVLRK
ncbi:class I SAM-dependent methyltransferase [Candidatus Woesearchaeota archaeon]|nr:class I SAM-dependent methyltransferase [Candidatus Woesearchaeota archaeon]